MTQGCGGAFFYMGYSRNSYYRGRDYEQITSELRANYEQIAHESVIRENMREYDGCCADEI